MNNDTNKGSSNQGKSSAQSNERSSQFQNDASKSAGKLQSDSRKSQDNK